MEVKTDMQTNVSLVVKDGKIQARLNYKNQDIPDPIYVEASGEDLEDVISDLYGKMMDSIDNLLTEPEEIEEETDDAEYIKRLEAQIDQLIKENNALKQKKEVTKKSPWYTYNTIKIPSSMNFKNDFEDIWKEFFE